MRFFATLKGNDKYYLLVAFKYKMERDTFVNHSEFRIANCGEVSKMSDKVYRLCRANEKAVYDQDGVRVAYLHSLYKGAIA